MNKRIRTILIIILTLFSILGFKDKVLALKWDEVNDYVFWNAIKVSKSEIESYRRDEDKNKTIEQVCMYYQDEEIGLEKSDINYVFIYTDGTASAAVPGTDQCSLKDSDSNVCLDNYVSNNTLTRGMMNWCANENLSNPGLTSDCKKHDSSALYKQIKTCPKYMIRVSNYSVLANLQIFGGTNHGTRSFFLDYTGKLKNIKSLYDYADYAAEGDAEGGTYIYYNVGEDILTTDSFTTCEYTEKGKTESVFKFVMNNYEGKPYILPEKGDTDSFSGDGSDHDLHNLYLSSLFLSSEHLKKLKNGCPNIIEACRRGNGWNSDLIIMGEVTGFGEKVCPKGDDKSFKFYCKGENCTDSENCTVYEEYEQELVDKLTEYKGAKDANDRRIILNEYNKMKDDFNSWCVSVMSFDDYYDGGCLQQCINIAKTVANLETDAGLRSPYGNEKCNIGENVLFMVYNVLKWAKYIAPILVIVLSILDFIKALAAQSDDEMKKAQGKFIKRLVVAALLFLIPLIINFVLKTFGFYHSGCDITDLFSGSK